MNEARKAALGRLATSRARAPGALLAKAQAIADLWRGLHVPPGPVFDRLRRELLWIVEVPGVGATYRGERALSMALRLLSELDDGVPAAERADPEHSWDAPGLADADRLDWWQLDGWRDVRVALRDAGRPCDARAVDRALDGIYDFAWRRAEQQATDEPSDDDVDLAALTRFASWKRELPDVVCDDFPPSAA